MSHCEIDFDVRRSVTPSLIRHKEKQKPDAKSVDQHMTNAQRSSLIIAPDGLVEEIHDSRRVKSSGK